MKDFLIQTGSRLAFLTLATLAWTGCGGNSENGSTQEAPEGMSPAAQPMPEHVQTLVTQGNDAQRAGDYQEAMVLYREAMAMAPDHPVPQFGALMAAMALGDEALTDSLSAILRETSPELLAMLNPDGSMGGGMPANPHAGGMPGGMPGGMRPEPADTTAPDTSGVH